MATAKDRLSYQDSIGAAISDLRNDEEDTFGGAWVEHSPTWQVVVRTTREGPPAATVASYFSGVPIHVTVRRDAPWSEAQTKENMRAVSEALEDVGDFVLAMDPRQLKGVIASLRVPADMTGATKEQLAALLPTLVTDKTAALEWYDAPLTSDDTVYGGASLVKNGSLNCTSGFSVEHEDGDGFVTAGHCSNLVTYETPDGDEYETTIEDFYEGHYGDFQWHSTDATEDNRIYTGTKALKTITSYEDDYGDLYVGQRVCMYGRTSGAHCADIGYVNVYWPAIRGRVGMETNEAEPGDSGGPWYYSRTAVGVHKGWTIIEGERRDVWSSVAYLDKALPGVEIMTS